MTLEAHAESAPRYEFLAQRATDFVRSHRGRASESELIQHVFGGNASASLWGPLLRAALASEPSLVQLADGSWTIEGVYQPESSDALSRFIALDVETTGLRPLNHRIIEVAAIRFQDGIEAGRFTTLLQPGVKLPAFITKLTGIRDLDLAEAPAFSDIADELNDFLGDELIVGHNVGFDISFVSGELKRIARPGLGNPRFDTMLASTRLIQGRRKNLSALARAVGVPVTKEHRAYDDARRTGEIALRLVDIAASKDITDRARFLQLGAAAPPGATDGNPHRRNALDRSILANIPKAPGVYIMRDAAGTVIYIGKAKNLRDRVGSYFSQALGYTRKMDGLLETLKTIRVEETGNELQALLLEAQLIRFYQPRFNTVLRASESYPYIKIATGNLWPRVSLSKERKNDGAMYYGPYRSRATATRIIEIIHRILPLRTCTRSFRNASSFGRPCLRLDLGQCAGPCMGVADRGQYLEHVRSVLRFMDGDDREFVALLHDRIEKAAAKFDYEKAQRLRSDLAIVQGVAQTQKEIAYAGAHHNAVIVQPAAKERHRSALMVLNGRLWAAIEFSEDCETHELAERLRKAAARSHAAPLPAIDHASVDDAIILNRWMRHQSGHPAILPLPDANREEAFDMIASEMLALPIEELNRDMVAESAEPKEERSDELILAERAQAYAEIGDSA